MLAVLHRRNPDSSAGYLFEDIRGNAVWLAFAVALVTTLGSLYLSRDRALHALPAVLVPAHLHVPARRSRSSWAGCAATATVWAYVLPPAVIGAVIAIYHTQLQAFPKQAHFCKIGTDSCTIRYVWEFGFVSIPFMSLAAFSFIIAMMLVVRSGRSDELEPEPTDASDPEDALALSARGAS